MKKTLLLTMYFTAIAGTVLIAGGADEAAAPGRGYGTGFINGDGVDIIGLSGTVEADSYGNLMIDKGKTNYLLAAVPPLGVSLKEGDVVDGEGFAGNTLYRKDGESFQNFHLTMANVNGEDYIIDLNGTGSPMGGYYGGMMYGGRGARGGMTGYGANGRGGMMGYGWDGAVGEETTLSGTLSYLDDFHPVLVTAEGNFLMRMGHWFTGGLPEGTEIEATGYAGPSLYTDGGEDYYSLILTSLIVNGKEVDTGYDNMPYGGMGFGGPMGGGRRR